MNISNELLAAYAEGKVSELERNNVRQYLSEHPEELESLMMMMDEDYDLSLDDESIASSGFDAALDILADELSNKTQHRILPLTAMAAQNPIDNRCAICCEGIALRHFGHKLTDEELVLESKQNGWLKAEGTTLHNIGCLAGRYGLGVSHRYNCKLDDIKDALSKGCIVIAAIDLNELTNDIETEKRKDIEVGVSPNHVVVVEKVEDEQIMLIDSSTPQKVDVYPIQLFLEAWEDSSHYLIIINDGKNYEPHPIDLSDVEITDDLIELREAIAENAHEVWAYNRKREGWAYGPERDDQKKLHPDMIAYSQLPESEKLYDREMAMNTIKLLKKLGWEIKKDNHDSRLYSQK